MYTNITGPYRRDNEGTASSLYIFSLCAEAFTRCWPACCSQSPPHTTAGSGDAVPVPADSPNYGISDHDLPLSSDDDESLVPLPFIARQVPSQPLPSQVSSA